jgi:hypothetical protein
MILVHFVCAARHFISSTTLKRMLHSKFIACVMQMYRTYSADEYDRRNEFVNPLAAQAEYELEKRVDLLDQFKVELDKS